MRSIARIRWLKATYCSCLPAYGVTSSRYDSTNFCCALQTIPPSFICSSYSSYAFPESRPLQMERNDRTPAGKPDNDVIESEEEDDDGSELDDGENNSQRSVDDPGLELGVKRIMDILCQPRHNLPMMKNMLEQSGITVSSELVVEVLSRVRNNWEAAFSFFLWAGKQEGHAHSKREYHSMISILAKMRKFDTAWVLIDEMRVARDGLSLVTSQTLLIMIRRYCAVHDVGRAVNTFHAHKQYDLDVGIDEFQGLLSALCRYKNVKDAEHLMFSNRTEFPLNTKSFNIILNGWCNVMISSRQGERIWREMSKRGIAHDVVSYSSIMSCYSKSNYFTKVLKLFDHLQEVGISPDRKVYNAVIHALAKGKFERRALDLIRSMEKKGIVPNGITYNSLIMPLCKARKLDVAKEVFDEMIQHGILPTVRIFNAFLRIVKSGEAVFELLKKMKTLGCPPSYDTYIMLLRKFCRWRQLDDVSKLWSEMNENGMSPDRSCYIVLIHGLFLNGMLEEAHKYYQEMKEKGFQPEPKTDEMLQAWVSGKEQAQGKAIKNESDEDCWRVGKVVTRNSRQERNFARQPETREVVRERGYSFWKD